MSQHNGISLWRQIGETLIEEIKSGVLPPDRRLPASKELAARFGVNRHTALRAIAHLQAEGFVRIERGRGSYAVVNPLELRIGPRNFFEQNVLENSRTPARTVLSIVKVAADAAVSKALKIGLGDPVALVTLLGEADKIPVNYNQHYFPLRRLPRIIESFRALGKRPIPKLSFSELLKGHGITDLWRKRIRIRSRKPSSVEAARLKMVPNDHVLETEVVLVDQRENPVVFATTCYCSSRVDLILEIPSNWPR